MKTKSSQTNKQKTISDVLDEAIEEAMIIDIRENLKKQRGKSRRRRDNRIRAILKEVHNPHDK